MKENALKHLIVVLLIIVMLLMFGCMQKVETQADFEKLFNSMGEQWVEAIKNRDATVLEQILAPDLVYHNYKGEILSRQDIMNLIKNDQSNYSSINASDIKVKMYSNELGVVTGSTRWIGLDVDGNEIDNNEQWTNVRMKRNGKWQCIIGHNMIL